MGRIRKELEREGYKTRRDRFNVYGAFVLPPVAFTSAIYFGALKGNPVEDPWYITLGKLGAAAAANIPLLPLNLSISVGLLFGDRMSKINKRSKLAAKVDPAT